MANIALVKPEWLEIINCCSPKVQMDLVRAIVAWQADGTMPDFRGVKKALFLMLVHDIAEKDIDPNEKPEEETAEEADAPGQTSSEPKQPSEEEQASEATVEADAHKRMPPATPPTENATAPRRHGGRSSFYPYRRLY